ncbi:MAG: alanine racemase, partial [Gemmatimonadales bacterium]
NSTDSRAWLTVDLRNLVHNVATVAAAARGASLLPMVKADGYGLGVGRVVECLERFDPWGYGVATIAEGAELRALGIKRPVIVFTPVVDVTQAAEYRAFDLTAVIDRPELAGAWDLPFHLEIDTGMSRTGLRWDDPDLAGVSSDRPEGVFTHFHSADEDQASVDLQWTRFESVCRRFEGALIHAANSAGVWSVPRALDLVRPGIFIYGGETRPEFPVPEPVVTFSAPVVSLRSIPSGDSVSYGAAWIAERPTEVATLGAGFADGIPRMLQGKGTVLIDGRRCRLIGKITMDMCMADVTDLPPGVRPGATAVFIGEDGEHAITLREFAESAGTSSYEILMGFRSRIERRYVSIDG